MTLLLAIFKSVCVLACLPACLSAFDQSVCMNVRRYPYSLKDVISGQEFGLKLCTGRCVTFLGKTLYSYIVSLKGHPGV